MQKFSFPTIACCLILFLTGCQPPPLEVDVDKLQQEIYEPTAVKLPGLGQSTILYLDHSTCVIDARQNSPVFRSLMGQLGLYTDILCLIKGADLEQIPNTDKSPTSTKVFNIINSIDKDIPFADIGQAVKNICTGNSQAILITDCEYFDSDKKNQDLFPYLSGSFKEWIKRGYSIYIVTEPYQERHQGKICDKKRFYFIFTNDKMQAPISANMLNELHPYLQNNLCKLFRLTNSDLLVQRQGKMFSEDLDISDVEQRGNFEYVEINDNWKTVREYVMKLDKYGEPLMNDDGTGNANPIPLVQNLVFNEGENYAIADVELVATNITAQYVALTDETVEAKVVNIPDGFTIDKQALKSNKLNVFVTEKIFNYLSDEYGGNLIRLDFVVTQAALKPFDHDIFTWQSLYNNDKAVCVSKSIDNVLGDIDIVPMSPDRRVIHTVFLKTQIYK
jgi:hypothetical protein